MAFDLAQVEPQLEYLVSRQLLGRREPDQVLTLVGPDYELPLTVVDGYPVVTQRVPTDEEAARFTGEPVLAPAAEVFQ